MMSCARAGLAVPRTDEIAIAPEGHQRLRSWFHPVAGDERQIAPRRAPRYGDLCRIGLKQFRSLFANPAKRVFDVLNDIGKLRFGRQTVVNRNEGISLVDKCLFEALVDSLAMPHDQRSPMDPDQHRPRRALTTEID